jgi:hypothetical protein
MYSTRFPRFSTNRRFSSRGRQVNRKARIPVSGTLVTTEIDATDSSAHRYTERLRSCEYLSNTCIQYTLLI